MRKYIYIFFILIILFYIISLYNYNNNNPKVIISRLIKKGDIQSDNLRYRIYLLGLLPIGEAVFCNKGVEEYQGHKVYRLNARAQSLRFFSKVFSGRAMLNSYVDIQELNPLLFRQKIIATGKKDINREVFYDQKQNIMSIAGVKRQILPNTQDPLSAIFNVRRMDFDKIKEFEMNINTNQKNYILRGVAEQKTLTINKKIYSIVMAKAEIKRRDKNPYHKSSINMVLLKEEENIPILIKVFSGGILINAKLTDMK